MAELDLDFSESVIAQTSVAQPSVTVGSEPLIPSPPATGFAQTATPPLITAPTPAPIAPVAPAAAVPQFGPTNDSDSVTFGDKNVELSNYARYKGRAQCTDVVGFISSSLKRAYTHFHSTGPRRGITFRCLSQRDSRGTVLKTEICCTMMGLARQVFGLVMFHYNSDQTGQLTAPNHPVGKLELWIISEAKFEEISGIHLATPLLDGYKIGPNTAANPTPNPIVVPPGPTAAQFDLRIKCTEAEYQRMSYVAIPNALWKRKPEWYTKIKALAAVAEVRLQAALGVVKTAAEVQQLLAASTAPAGSPTSAAGAMDFSDLGIGDDPV